MPGKISPGRWLGGGHLGPSVSALVDGQLDDAATERAWEHAMSCPGCRRLVEREGWMKTRLAELSGRPALQPPSQLLGSLYGLDPATEEAAREARAAWAAVERLEERGRGRRRAGLVLAGAGSMSAAVLGLSTLTGATLGIGGAPAGPPTSSLTRPTPTAQPAPAASRRPSPGRQASADPGWQSPFPGWVQAPPRPDLAQPVSSAGAR